MVGGGETVIGLDVGGAGKSRFVETMISFISLSSKSDMSIIVLSSEAGFKTGSRVEIKDLLKKDLQSSMLPC